MKLALTQHLGSPAVLVLGYFPTSNAKGKIYL